MLGSREWSSRGAPGLPAVTHGAAPTVLECDTLGGPAREWTGVILEIAELRAQGAKSRAGDFQRDSAGIS